jgi:hypothetical protein
MSRNPVSQCSHREIFKEMSDNLKPIAKKIRSMLYTQNKQHVLVRYDIGAMLRPISVEEGAYGSAAIEEIAAYTQVAGGDRTLYDLLRFAQAFDRNFVAEQLGKPMSNGAMLGLYHFIVLMQIPSHKVRIKLLNRIRAESLSIDALQKEIAANYGETAQRRAGGGRKLRPPSSPRAGLSRWTTDTHRMVKLAQQMAEAVWEKLLETPPDAIDDRLLEQIAEAETATAAIAELLPEVLEHLHDIRARVQGVLHPEDQTTPSPTTKRERPPKTSARMSKGKLIKTKKATRRRPQPV